VPVPSFLFIPSFVVVSLLPLWRRLLLSRSLVFFFLAPAFPLFPESPLLFSFPRYVAFACPSLMFASTFSQSRSPKNSTCYFCNFQSINPTPGYVVPQCPLFGPFNGGSLHSNSQMFLPGATPDWFIRPLPKRMDFAVLVFFPPKPPPPRVILPSGSSTTFFFRTPRKLARFFSRSRNGSHSRHASKRISYPTVFPQMTTIRFPSFLPPSSPFVQGVPFHLSKLTVVKKLGGFFSVVSLHMVFAPAPVHCFAVVGLRTPPPFSVRVLADFAEVFLSAVFPLCLKNGDANAVFFFVKKDSRRR